MTHPPAPRPAAPPADLALRLEDLAQAWEVQAQVDEDSPDPRARRRDFGAGTAYAYRIAAADLRAVLHGDDHSQEENPVLDRIAAADARAWQSAQAQRVLQRQVQELSAALDAYGAHGPGCAYTIWPGGGDPPPCTCGLDAARAGHPAERMS